MTVREQYEAMLNEALGRLGELEESKKTIIQVGSATCENAAGSRDVYDEFQKHIEASGRDDIILRQTGCTGRCSCEPIVGVFQPGQMPLKYQLVDRKKVHDIFTQHIQGGNPIYEHTLDHAKDASLQY